MPLSKGSHKTVNRVGKVKGATVVYTDDLTGVTASLDEWYNYSKPDLDKGDQERINEKLLERSNELRLRSLKRNQYPLGLSSVDPQEAQADMTCSPRIDASASSVLPPSAVIAPTAAAFGAAVAASVFAVAELWLLSAAFLFGAALSVSALIVLGTRRG